LQPGQSKTATFTLSWDDFAFIGRDNKPVVEPGKFKVAVANLTHEFQIR
jgi:beta-glucosidase